MTQRNENLPAETRQENPQETAAQQAAAAGEGNLLALLHAYRRYIIGAGLGIAAAVLFMLLGFWRTIFLLLMAALGAFAFGVDQKAEWLRKLLNKVFPPKG